MTITCAALQRAGVALLDRFSADARPSTAAGFLQAMADNELAVKGPLESALLAAVPGSTLLADDAPLPVSEDTYGWVIDAVEGNINHVHGREEWAVTACLVRGREPVLAAVHVPRSGSLFTAVAGEGATDGERSLHVSGKEELTASIAATAQAQPFEAAETLAIAAHSFHRMLTASLLVRASVPSTIELLDLASGRLDAFWQYAGVASGLAAGALLVREAGGLVTDEEGRRWRLGSRGFVASTPGIHDELLRSLGATA
ncbi:MULTISPECIES: inositol monophosphatase family protein [Rhodanobacteraceae]|uniref:inositol monophosphatase family protein n=1 Tax=Rhodanobacteraceae TaxID=1775411 RepID=UPI0009A669DF|nr:MULTISPECIES: inositol monophosphatase family protein [Rhodanobacteraceae]MDR6642430.1 myo-inositol-1(or 4)-monophosphatase [Luteibacter sp. 1214]